LVNFILLLLISLSRPVLGQEKILLKLNGRLNPSAIWRFVNGNPTLPGQDVFGAIQEIITILKADRDTDWSKVNISKLRSHLVEMNRLVMDTQVARKNIDNGLQLTVTGSVWFGLYRQYRLCRLLMRR